MKKPSTLEAAGLSGERCIHHPRLGCYQHEK